MIALIIYFCIALLFSFLAGYTAKEKIEKPEIIVRILLISLFWPFVVVLVPALIANYISNR
jgi:ABC-type glycerol-3-phosphate transport system permease component